MSEIRAISCVMGILLWGYGILGLSYPLSLLFSFCGGALLAIGIFGFNTGNGRR